MTTTKLENQSVTCTIEFTYQGEKFTLGALLTDKEGVTTFTEGLDAKGTYVKLGDNYCKNLTVGEKYTFMGRAHLAKKKPSYYIFNPIL